MSSSDSTASAKPPGVRSGRIYTRVGDAGQTSLLGKVRVWKDTPRINVYGTIDEATSALGMARATTRSEDICSDILTIQGELIDLMTVLATPPGVQSPSAPPGNAQIQRLEQRIDSYEDERIATNHFIRPGGSLASAALDLARTIVRRAERLLVALSREEPVDPGVERYLNRLSDLLYVIARVDEQREIKRLVLNALEPVQERTQIDSRLRFPLDLASSDRLIEAGMRRACEIGVPMVLAVVDDAGCVIQLRRMDNALLVSIELAPNKAKTAAVVRMATHELAAVAQPGGPLYGIDANMRNLTLVGGGLPLTVNGTVVGAVGVSGGSAEQDIDVARAMVSALC